MTSSGGAVGPTAPIVKVTEVGVDHLNDVDVVEQFDPRVGGNHHEVSNQCFIRDDEGRINVLSLINHSVRCKALGEAN